MKLLSRGLFIFLSSNAEEINPLIAILFGGAIIIFIVVITVLSKILRKSTDYTKNKKTRTILNVLGIITLPVYGIGIIILIWNYLLFSNRFKYLFCDKCHNYEEGKAWGYDVLHSQEQYKYDQASSRTIGRTRYRVKLHTICNSCGDIKTWHRDYIVNHSSSLDITEVLERDMNKKLKRR
jgi:NADH:ubiquinone oxidoreductase subunit F (NADH-binding)